MTQTEAFAGNSQKDYHYLLRSVERLSSKKGKYVSPFHNLTFKRKINLFLSNFWSNILNKPLLHTSNTPLNKKINFLLTLFKLLYSRWFNKAFLLSVDWLQRNKYPLVKVEKLPQYTRINLHNKLLNFVLVLESWVISHDAKCQRKAFRLNCFVVAVTVWCLNRQFIET